MKVPRLKIRLEVWTLSSSNLDFGLDNILFQRLLMLQQEVLSSPSSTDSSCDSGVCMSAMTPSSIPTPPVSDKTPAPIPPPRTSVPAPPPRQVRFQCQPTKCLEYARDNKTDNDVPAKVGEADEEDPNKKKVHNVTFAETECNIREFVPDQQLVNLKLWNYSNEFKSPR